MVLKMEVLLFALFFIASIIFFIAGKDDFGRTDNRLIMKEREKVKGEVKIDPKEEYKTEAELNSN